MATQASSRSGPHGTIAPPTRSTPPWLVSKGTAGKQVPRRAARGLQRGLHSPGRARGQVRLCAVMWRTTAPLMLSYVAHHSCCNMWRTTHAVICGAPLML